MIFRRGGFALTPPSMLVFAVSLALALVALLAYYRVVQIAALGSGRAFLILAIAYLLLVAGVVFRRL